MTDRRTFTRWMYIVTEELPPSPTQSRTLFFWNTTQDLAILSALVGQSG